MFFNYELAGLTSEAAIQVDNYLLGRSDDLSKVYELSDTVKENIPREGEFISLYSLNLWKAMGGESSEVRWQPGLALQMRLLGMDLDDVERLPRDRLEEMRGFLVDCSRQFRSESGSFKRYAA